MSRRSVALSDLPASVRAKLTIRKTPNSAVLKKLREAQETFRQESFLTMLRQHKLPTPKMEFRFHPTRMWRFDWAWPDHKIALEVNGGVFTQGRHTRGKGATEDMAKQNAAAVLGWRMLYCTPEQLHGAGIQEALRRVLRPLPESAPR